MTATADNPYNQTIIPTLTLNGAAEAIDLYVKAFGAKELAKMNAPDGSGKIMWSMILLGNSKIFLMDTSEHCATPSTSSFYVYFDNVDAAFTQAKSAGLKEAMAPQDMFYGDRCGNVTDKFGISWSLAQHIRDVSEDEMCEAMKKMAAEKAA